jgi:hypothetical protein
MVNSRAKGGRVERLVVDWLKDHGCPSARRSVQYCGRGGESADILCDELALWHFEVKGTASPIVPRSTALKWFEQVKTDCPSNKRPILIHVPNNNQWTAWEPWSGSPPPQTALLNSLDSFNVSQAIERSITIFGERALSMFFALNSFEDALLNRRYGWSASLAHYWLAAQKVTPGLFPVCPEQSEQDKA